MTVALRQQAPNSPETSVTKVMIVDDSAVIRGLVSRWLEPIKDIVVVASAANGAHALRQIATADVDVIVLDIEMPEMDGMTALPKLLAARPGVQVLMASTLTARNAEISMRALDLGAADYITKPTARVLGGTEGDYQRDLIEKIRALAPRARRPAGLRPSAGQKPSPAQPLPAAGKAIQLRPLPPVVSKPEVLLIGSSTGGPQALCQVLKALTKPVRVPILITQHMPPTFTAILAQHLEKACGLVTREASDGDLLAPNRIWVARGDWHMRLARADNGLCLKLDQEPQENFCRPAVDPLFRSAAQVLGGAVAAVVLTGMGQDGALGAKAIAEGGGMVVAQDEASSVVWGMPGAVATRGYAHHVSPLDRIPVLIDQVLKGALA